MSPDAPPPPPWMGEPPEPIAAAARRGAWAIHVISELRAQGLSGPDRVLLLTLALGHEIAACAAGQEAETLAYVGGHLGRVTAGAAMAQRAHLAGAAVRGSA